VKKKKKDSILYFPMHFKTKCYALCRLFQTLALWVADYAVDNYIFSVNNVGCLKGTNAE